MLLTKIQKACMFNHRLKYSLQPYVIGSALACDPSSLKNHPYEYNILCGIQTEKTT